MLGKRKWTDCNISKKTLYCLLETVSVRERFIFILGDSYDVHCRSGTHVSFG